MVVSDRTHVPESTQAYAHQLGVPIVRDSASNLAKTAAEMGVVAPSVGPSPQAQSEADGRSSAIRSGDVRLTADGRVDGRSAGVCNGQVLLTQDGRVDRGRARRRSPAQDVGAVSVDASVVAIESDWRVKGALQQRQKQQRWWRQRRHAHWTPRRHLLHQQLCRQELSRSLVLPVICVLF